MLIIWLFFQKKKKKNVGFEISDYGKTLKLLAIFNTGNSNMATFFSYRGKACLAKQELAVLPSALVAASQRSLSTDLQSWILST